MLTKIPECHYQFIINMNMLKCNVSNIFFWHFIVKKQYIFQSLENTTRDLAFFLFLSSVINHAFWLSSFECALTFPSQPQRKTDIDRYCSPALLNNRYILSHVVKWLHHCVNIKERAYKNLNGMSHSMWHNHNPFSTQNVQNSWHCNISYRA